MARATTEQADHNQFQAMLTQGSREGALIALAALCVFLLMALISHSPADPAWTSTGESSKVLNLGGKAGAWFSDIMLYFFGYVAYLFPVLVAARALLLFKDRNAAKLFHWPMFTLRLAGLLMILLSTTSLLALYSVAGSDQDAGGILGLEFAGSLVSGFNLLGATLCLVTMLLFGITVFTGLSWLALMDRTGHFTLVGLTKSRTWLSDRNEQFKDYRAVKKTERQEAKQSTPKINNRDTGKSFSTWLSRLKPSLKSFVETEELEALPVAERQEPTLDGPIAVKATKKPKQSESADSVKIAPFEKKKSQAKAEKQGKLFISSEGHLPSVNLLDPPEEHKKAGYSAETLTHMSRLLEEKLADFGVSATVVEVNPGPVITRFEIQPAAGVKVSKISNLAKDLARSLAVIAVRVVEVIPGKSVVGIEIPNENRDIVRFSESILSSDYKRAESPLTMGLGNDIAGDPIVADLGKMPHLLVAGTTGSGKSVGVNCMILSILFKATPEEVRFIMIDPKMLELSIYDGIPHLLTPVVTDMKDAANSLRWCVAEMERRYKLMAALGVRNIAGFNRKLKEAQSNGSPIKDPLWNPDEFLDNTEADRPELETLPFIVVVIDEFADMMMIVGKKVEELIARIAQKARAAGIHLILATQRPSVDVITGLIKANVPTRISFRVATKVDSRTILDQGGAEQLLGHGDMLYVPPGTSLPIRVHGAFVDDHEVHKVVDDWKQRGEPDYIESILSGGESTDPAVTAFTDDPDNEQDALYDEAVAFVTESRRASISSVQRKLKIGYNRAANLVEAMETAGVVSPAGHNGSREVLAPPPPPQ